MKKLTVLMAALVCAAAAQAQTIYRCGASYSQTPCAQGRAIVVNDGPTAQQQQEALDVAARDRYLGDTLEQDRLTQEAMQRPASAGKIDGRVGHATQWRDVPSAKSHHPRKKHAKSAPHRPAERYKAVSTAGV
ncbi:MAG: hypothetical protein ABW190_15170 [Rhizobacter sp.]